MWQYNYEYLCHGIKGYKYIDRKMGKNGKWQYTYPDTSLNKKESAKSESEYLHGGGGSRRTDTHGGSSHRTPLRTETGAKMKIPSPLTRFIYGVTKKELIEHPENWDWDDKGNWQGSRYGVFAPNKPYEPKRNVETNLKPSGETKKQTEDQIISEYNSLKTKLKTTIANRGERDQLLKRIDDIKKRNPDLISKEDRKTDAKDLRSLIDEYEAVQKKYESAPKGTEEKARYQAQAKSIYNDINQLYYDLKIKKYADVAVDDDFNAIIRAKRLASTLALM